MMKKVLMYGVVGMLAVALVGGTAYILLNSEGNEAGTAARNGQARTEATGTEGQSSGNRGNQGDVATSGQSQNRGADSEGSTGGYRGGQAAADLTASKVDTAGDDRGSSGYRGGSGGRGQSGNGTSEEIVWEVVTGEVIIADDEITVQTAQGSILIGLGQAAYREGFALDEGDMVSVTGFFEDGEFKAGTVNNMSTGESLALRDGNGRPMWAGGAG
jgi:hypothetical protein